MATVETLASLVGGEVVGDPSRAIEGVAGLDEAGPRDISFLAHSKYRARARRSAAGAILTRELIDGTEATQVLCEDPYLAMATVARALHPPPSFEAGIHPSAWVASDARVDPSASIRPGAIVEAGAHIGARTVLQPGAYVGPKAVVGTECVLHPGARVLERCRLGDRVVLHAGVVVGSDGFGYARDHGGRRQKIPQVGIVVLEDDVEVGANTTIDRATFGETRVGRGTKIDNLVQIAHNVVLGTDCVVVSQSGIAGSTRIGDRVVLGAQTGVVGHIAICDDVMLAARAGVAQAIETPGVYSGTPAIPHRQWLRAVMSLPHLPELRRQVRQLLRGSEITNPRS